MKSYTKYLIIVLALLFCDTLNAQLPTQGKWGTYKGVVDAPSGETVIELTGDVEMHGVIRILAGSTLKIVSKKDVTIKNVNVMNPSENYNNPGRSRFFTNRGVLIIEGQDGATITLDGGAAYSWSDYTLTPGANSRKLSEMIANEGTLRFKNVTIQDVNTDDPEISDNGGAFLISNAATLGTTVLENCTIQRCYAPLGSAIMIGAQTNSVSYTPEDHKVELINSLIQHCVSGRSTGSNSGGTIRTYGNTVSNLYLTNTTFSENYAMRNTKITNTLTDDGNGGALFWNAHGSDFYESICYIDGCKFLNNKSDDRGGAIKSQGSLKFVNNKTLLKGNMAPYGGGLYIEGYHGGANQVEGASNIQVDLNEFLELQDNISMPASATDIGNGGGIEFYFSNAMDLNKGSKITINLDGAIINGNVATGNGGGIHIENATDPLMEYEILINLNYGELTNNSAANGGGVYISKGDVTSNNIGGKVLLVDNNVVTDNGAGICIIDGGMYMANGTISNNKITEDGNGAGIYVLHGDFTMEDGAISYNTTSKNGGGVYVDGGNFTMNDGTISQNSITLDGGGAYVVGGGSFEMNGGSIMSNTTNGGNGGGVYLSGGDFIINSGAVSDNEAYKNGGALYIVGGGSLTMASGTISQNSTSTGDGGGIYINGGNITVTDGSLIENVSGANGGGVCLLDGTVEMGNGRIANNKSSVYGGGVYVYNSVIDSPQTVNFSGGSLVGNSSKYGGGVCVNGNISLIIGNVEIAENVAENGGGATLLNGASVLFGKGEIKNNRALKSGSAVLTSAYQKEINEVTGIGGGIYLSGNTTLTFTEIESIGLFGNFADNGADEIFANGKNTSVDLPNVNHMALTGYPGASNLKWMEDYITNDINYDKGTKIKGDIWDYDKTNKRYRDAEAPFEVIASTIDDSHIYTNYLCLAIGYEILYITIIKKGLAKGESAIFNLKRGEQNNFNIIMTGDGSASVKKMVAVTVGDWTVSEIGWSWTYTADKTSITKNIASEANRVFEFTNVKKDHTTLPMNDEAIKINVMGGII
ncbi:MAG: hypothetical protein E7071_06705 [Bacteroidales bacterium]|nr:hypothetical protein [Bacteroidales bacterium]